ncbi:MAG: hypothetical protein IMW90_04555 [Thermogemmatispora sp.]|jgi:hypothetical protein|uniref:DUF4177 domain-containing protein n=1 Tax=Thermogemmatispora aurantia TaxID=2045279 RepID=A0A5J4KAL8_9CHLR|nr:MULTISPECIES: hypothetical protein [Thermogemmatispora]MBE3564980.1 hypothetical protein [Thermogemmatispora sp.]GER83701.1 hypothetical protein KTAU_23380 [Thermogemmatispora aurantia]
MLPRPLAPFLSYTQEHIQSTLHIPIVYEEHQLEPPRWEYRLISLDLRKEPLLSEASLARLGQEGWLLQAIVDERASGSGTQLHYYFVRRLLESRREAAGEE